MNQHFALLKYYATIIFMSSLIERRMDECNIRFGK